MLEVSIYLVEEYPMPTHSSSPLIGMQLFSILTGLTSHRDVFYPQVKHIDWILIQTCANRTLNTSNNRRMFVADIFIVHNSLFINLYNSK